MPIHNVVGALRELHQRRPPKHKAFDFRVVEDDRVGPVTKQSWPEVGKLPCDTLARDMNRLGLHADGAAQKPGKVIPGYVLV